MLTYEEHFEEVRKEVLSRIDIGNEVSDQGIKETIEEVLGEYCRQTYVPLTQRQNIYKEIFYQLRQLDILQELLENPDVTDLASTNGTELDGELLTPNIPYVIHEGAEVKLGKSLFRFEMV